MILSILIDMLYIIYAVVLYPSFISLNLRKTKRLVKMLRLKPSEIMYSQASISNRFKARSIHRDKLIGETLDDICEGRSSITEIPQISVMEKDGRWVTADNRRLWIFRELERLGKCEDISVCQVYSIDPKKMNSTNGGVSVHVRRLPGGKWHYKPSAG